MHRFIQHSRRRRCAQRSARWPSMVSVRWSCSNTANLGALTVRGVMNGYPPTCTPDADVDEVRSIMLKRHARYLPVLEARTLMGVISFYDVAKAVVEANDFENRMLKAYIR